MPHASGTPAIYVQAPVLALIWGLIAVPLAWREKRLRTGVATALIALGGLLVLIMSSGARSLLPTLYEQIQFTYRLQSYVTLACAGLVLLGALALTRRAQSGRATRSDRRLALGLGLAVAFGLALSAWQLWVPNTHVRANSYFGGSYSNRVEALRGLPTLLPRTWYAHNDYGDSSLPVVATTAQFAFDPARVDDDRFAGSVSLPPGVQPFATNIAGGPYLVRVAGGARVVGRTAEGNLVLQRATNGSQPVPVVLSARLGTPVVLGRIITAASAALLLAWAVSPPCGAGGAARKLTPRAIRSAVKGADAVPTPSGARRRLGTSALVDVAIATLVVLLIASPLLLTSDGFALDFTNAMWLAGYQQDAIAAHLHPTLFLQTQQGGVFGPLFAFYGGTLFALTGALAVILGGSTNLAFTLMTLAAIAAAYGGLFWLARQLGVRGALTHAPAIVFVTSAYYVTDLYGRGRGPSSWPSRRCRFCSPRRCASCAGAGAPGQSPAWWRRAWCSAAATTSRFCGARRSRPERSSSTGF